MKAHNLIFGEEAPPEIETAGNRRSGNEGWSRKITTIELIDNRIYFYSEIYREDVLGLNRHLRELRGSLIRDKITREISDVKMFLHIQSYGGNIFTGLSAMDEILSVRKEVPVITVVDGCCASAATFLSIVGSHRLINRHSFMLIHQLSSMFWGKYEEFEDEKSNLDKLMETIKGIYGEYTKIPQKEIEKILKHDLWLSSKKCLEYGLVDEII